MLRPLSRPIRIVLLWQLAATAVMAMAGGILAGGHGALSGAAGGTISVLAGLAAAWIAARRVKSAGEVLVGALMAVAYNKGDFALLGAAVFTLCLIVVLVNKFVWRKLYTIAQERYALNV